MVLGLVQVGKEDMVQGLHGAGGRSVGSLRS